MILYSINAKISIETHFFIKTYKYKGIHSKIQLQIEKIVISGFI